uniref:peptidylprolyl isomerase n=1 Tax=Ciona savignyi TaxID=51511 RepID=H2Z070_CIOSA
MIAGLDVGVGTMRRNEVSRFLIEPSYAYGVMGCPPRIPSNAKVCFEVELLSYTDSTAIDDYQHLSEEEKRDLPFERLVKVSKSLNAEGNELYLCEKFGAAVRKYMKAINTMESATYKSEEEEQEMTTICTKSYLNIGLSYLKTGSFGRALDSARKVLVLKPGHTKAMYLCGKAFRHLGEFPKSRIYLQRALAASPRSKDIITELKLLDQMELNFQAMEKQMCKKMFT